MLSFSLYIVSFQEKLQLVHICPEVGTPGSNLHTILMTRLVDSFIAGLLGNSEIKLSKLQKA